ncbi:EAL domain-containing protein [Luteimonas aestuarii]|uniref:EAL domain-containing protein n=1 Tax=Luteimonas aestuarii TaxID=453837 RepID=A0A4R5TQW0_9GAMM|nr:EAL domain-containing response regulator [Luteimonas aestuarii]TDK21489.1 EAL domain-containing protein [Luteimonas aestuarii]
MNILILDDDPFMLKLMGLQLKAFGLRHRGFMDTVACQQAKQAVETLEAGTDLIGLIFCDLQMPEMDGIEFIRHLVRLDYRGGLVLMSGEEERVLQAAEQMARAHGLHVLGSLQKPVYPDALRQVLDATLPEAPRQAEPNASAYTPDELLHAIADGQLVNRYQPKVDLRTGEVVGMEALVRWRHPVDGLVAPGAFIPMAEEAGIVGKLGDVVLSAALRDLAAWRAAGHRLHVAVNISLACLDTLDYPDTLARQLAEAAVPANQLILEITESRVLENPAAQLDVLTRLRLKQVGLAIDDFGTGYSSLANLRDLPLVEIKIDRGFVHGAAGHPGLQAILGTSLGLARQLRLVSVAEGVEDRADLDFLRQAGFDLVQGYLIARPMPAEEVEPWLQAWPTQRTELFA